jgi:Tfp pilus assembly protein PilZ
MKIIKRLLFALFMSFITFLGMIIFCIKTVNVMSEVFLLFEIDSPNLYLPDAYKAIKVCAVIGSLIGFIIGLKIDKSQSRTSD